MKQHKPVSSPLVDSLKTTKSKERLNILETALENSGVSVKEVRTLLHKLFEMFKVLRRLQIFDRLIIQSVA